MKQLLWAWLGWIFPTWWCERNGCDWRWFHTTYLEGTKGRSGFRAVAYEVEYRQARCTCCSARREEKEFDYDSIQSLSQPTTDQRRMERGERIFHGAWWGDYLSLQELEDLGSEEHPHYHI